MGGGGGGGGGVYVYDPVAMGDTSRDTQRLAGQQMSHGEGGGGGGRGGGGRGGGGIRPVARLSERGHLTRDAACCEL